MGMPLLRREYTYDTLTDEDTPGLAADRKRHIGDLLYWYDLERAKGIDARPHVLLQRRREIRRYGVECR